MSALWSICKNKVDYPSLSELRSEKGYQILVTGPDKSYKSTFLFNFAYELANQGETVIFICIKSKIEANLPVYVDCSSYESGKSPNHDTFHHSILSRIRMHYVSTFTELITAISKLHLYEIDYQSPSCVLIDDISDLVSGNGSPSNPNMLLKNRLLLLALLDDAFSLLQKKIIEKSQSCGVFMMVDSSDDRHVTALYPRLVDTVITTVKQYNDSYDVTFTAHTTKLLPTISTPPITLFHATQSGDRIVIT